MMTDARTSGFHWNLGGKEGDERIRRENARERERECNRGYLHPQRLVVEFHPFPLLVSRSPETSLVLLGMIYIHQSP